MRKNNEKGDTHLVYIIYNKYLHRENLLKVKCGVCLY